MIRTTILTTLLFPSMLWAQDMTISNAYIPLAPKGVMAHAAYMEITNTGDETRSLIGLMAPAYAMAHLHQSSEKDGIATMSAMHQLDIKPGQTVTLQPGGLHIMLMKPSAMMELGDEVELKLEFANGETLPVAASVVTRDGSS